MYTFPYFPQFFLIMDFFFYHFIILLNDVTIGGYTAMNERSKCCARDSMNDIILLKPNELVTSSGVGNCVSCRINKEVLFSLLIHLS